MLNLSGEAAQSQEKMNRVWLQGLRTHDS